jgi:hypothetical protein
MFLSIVKAYLIESLSGTVLAKTTRLVDSLKLVSDALAYLFRGKEKGL